MKLFDLGTIEISTAAKAALKVNNLSSGELLSRHQQGDWGDLDALSCQNNDTGIHDKVLLKSRYIIGDGTELFISTAGDRSQTQLFLETDYRFEEVNTQAGYAIWASTYDQGRNPLIEAEELFVAELIDGLPISTVLDVGTGTGRYALKFAHRGANVTALDQSPEMLALAQEKASGKGLNIDFRLGSVNDELPFDAHQFDFLICALMLSHIPEFAQVAQKFYNVLQSGGHLLITAYHPDIIKHGWRTVFDRPQVTYGLPNVSRSRAEYLEILKSSGFNVLSVVDVPVRDVPAGIFPETVVAETGDINLCLIILAEKR